ncbi:MAG: hypothetical protein AAFU64_13235 [Bacteroidota bacterium]
MSEKEFHQLILLDDASLEVALDGMMLSQFWERIAYLKKAILETNGAILKKMKAQNPKGYQRLMQRLDQF